MFFKCKWDLYECTQWHREGCEHSVKSKIMTRIQYDIHWYKNLTAISGDTELSDVSPNSFKSRDIQAEWVTGCHPAVKWMWTAARICLRSLTFDCRFQDLEHILGCETLEENSWDLAHSISSRKDINGICSERKSTTSMKQHANYKSTVGHAVVSHVHLNVIRTGIKLHFNQSGAGKRHPAETNAKC